MTVSDGTATRHRHVHLDGRRRQSAAGRSDGPRAQLPPTAPSRCRGRPTASPTWPATACSARRRCRCRRPATAIAGASLLASPAYTDTTAVNGTTYDYVVVAVDTAAMPRRRRPRSTRDAVGERRHASLAAERHEPVRDVRCGAGPGCRDVHARDLVQAHRHGRRARSPARAASPMRSRSITKGRAEAEGLERRHELLPRHRRRHEQARRRLRGHRRRRRAQPSGHRQRPWSPATSGITPPPPMTARPGACTSTARSTDARRRPASRRESDSIQHAAIGTRHDQRPASQPASSRASSTRRASGTSPAAARRSGQQGLQRDHRRRPGLIGRYGLNEGVGTAVGNSSRVAPTAPPSAARPGSPASRAPTSRRRPPRPGSRPRRARRSSRSPGTRTAESDLAGYRVYRATSTPVSTTGTPLNGATPAARRRRYTDSTAVNGTTYYYVVAPWTRAGNASAASADVVATPTAAAGSAIQFNGIEPVRDVRRRRRPSASRTSRSRPGSCAPAPAWA